MGEGLLLLTDLSSRLMCCHLLYILGSFDNAVKIYIDVVIFLFDAWNMNSVQLYWNNEL